MSEETHPLYKNSLERLGSNRKPEEERELKYQTGICLSAQGSCQLEQGKTKVIVNVLGPKQTVFREKETSKTIIRTKTFPESPTINKIVSAAIENSLKTEKYPDSILEVSITIICDDGGLKTCAINATILALLDAGFELKSLAASSNMVIKGSSFNYDPSLDEERFSDGVATFVYDTKTGVVFSSFYEGCITQEQLHEALNRATYNITKWNEIYERVQH